MATLPKIVYNFNENSATTIRDYSENGNDATSSTITVASSTRVGYDAVFDSVTEVLNLGNITYLNGVTSCALHFGLWVDASAGATTSNILTKSGLVQVAYNYGLGEIEITFTDATATTGTVNYALSLDTWYDIDVVYASNVITLYVDGTSVDTNSDLTGALATNSNTMYLGYDGVTDAAEMLINEFKLYNTSITTDNIAAFIAEQNGVLSDSSRSGGFAVGDIIAANLEQSTKYYAIVSWVGTDTDYRILPLTDNIRGGLIFARVGNLFNTDRQWAFKIDDTPQICFYDGVSKSSEVYAASKKVYCMTKDGIIKNSSTKTANYTTISTDQRIYVDSSGGAFTITLEASPTTNNEIEIIDSVGSCGATTVTINGNGNNIMGSTTALMNSNYIAYVLVFNGTEWNLK